MSLEISGKLIVKKKDQEVSASFKKREFVIETNNDQYPQEIQLELHQDRVDLIDAIELGTEIKCSINIRGKKYTPPLGEDKWFNTIVCWKVEKVLTN